jgi:hypothetical protein
MPEPYASETGRDVALALARLEEAERELALARSQRDAKVADLEERLGWLEDHELDLRAAAERHAWLHSLLGAWSRSVRTARRLRRLAGR